MSFRLAKCLVTRDVYSNNQDKEKPQSRPFPLTPNIDPYPDLYLHVIE